MQNLFDHRLETTPEDLLPIINKLLKKLTDRNAIVYDSLDLEILPEVQRKTIQLENGTYTEIEQIVPASRPENINIIFFNRKIGTIQAIQTSRYPSSSNVKIWSLIEQGDDKFPDGLGGYKDAMVILNFIIDGISSEFRINGINRSIIFTKKNPGGRPSNKSYDESYQHMLKTGCSKYDAYLFWEENYPDEISMFNWVDNKKRFYKAMNYRKTTMGRELKITMKYRKNKRKPKMTDY